LKTEYVLVLSDHQITRAFSSVQANSCVRTVSGFDTAQ